VQEDLTHGRRRDAEGDDAYLGATLRPVTAMASKPAARERRLAPLSMSALGRNRQLMSREATTAIPGIAAIGGVIATGSKGSGCRRPGFTPTMACGRGAGIWLEC